MAKARASVIVVAICTIASAQIPGQVNATESATKGQGVPFVVRFSGTLLHLDGSPFSSPEGVTFAVYENQTGGAALWDETQTVVPDRAGHFTVLLGTASAEGLPVQMFSSAAARWLGLTPDDGVERPRVPFVSVPYALKAAAADTLNGMTAQDFVSQQQLNSLLSPSSMALSRECPVRLVDCVLDASPPSPISASTFEATSPLGPSFISDALSGPPFKLSSRELVANLNAELLHVVITYVVD